jgi:hypothetical protein
VANAVQNGQTFRLGAGNYKVQPSILNSNLTAGNTFTGITVANKTNLIISGIPGSTVIDGSSALGEAMWISNCARVYIFGVTFRGMTNHNRAALPPYTSKGANAYLWALVNLYKSEHITFDSCRFERSADHGLQDKGAENSIAVASSPISTNDIRVVNCVFEDIGGCRTNALGNNDNGQGFTDVDGAAIVATGWKIDNCKFFGCQRGVEPFDDMEATGTPFLNFVVRDCDFYNMVEFAVSPAGSTNCQFGQVMGNTLVNDPSFSYHGTNWGAGGIALPTVGFNLNAGRGWLAIGNKARGGMFTAYQLGNDTSFVDDCLLDGNLAQLINRGDGLGLGYIFGSGLNNAAAASSVRRLTAVNNKAINTANAGYWIASGRDIVFENNYGFQANAYAVVANTSASLRIGSAGASAGKITNCIVRGNTMLDGGFSGPFGYYLDDNIQSAIFQDNYAQGYSANGGITNASGANVSIFGPVRTFVASLDFPSVPANASTNLTIAATGVTTNDIVQLTVPAIMFASGVTAQAVFTAWPSNDAVYVRLSNNDAANATVDFAAAPFAVAVRAARIQGQ